jgi:hypothetical protein
MFMRDVQNRMTSLGITDVPRHNCIMRKLLLNFLSPLLLFFLPGGDGLPRCVLCVRNTAFSLLVQIWLHEAERGYFLLSPLVLCVCVCEINE